MTDDERSLLLHVARWVADQIGSDAEVFGETDKEAEDIRTLIDRVRLGAIGQASPK